MVQKNYLMEEKFIITFSFITYHLERISLFLLIQWKFKIHHTKKKFGKENIIITPQRIYFSHFFHVAWTKSWLRRFFLLYNFLCQLRDKVTALLRKHRYFFTACHNVPSETFFFGEEWDTHKNGINVKTTKRRRSTREWKELKMEIIKFS